MFLYKLFILASPFLLGICPNGVKWVAAMEGFGLCNQWFDYVRVRKDSHVFLWLLQCNPDDMFDYESPVEKSLIVHVGGPEMSASGLGLFYETGPMTHKNTTRALPITDLVNVLYIDLPVGVGFSHTKDRYSGTMTEVAEDLFKAVIYALDKQPELKTRPILFYSESIACHYTLEAVRLLIQEKIEFELAGVVLASPWIMKLDDLVKTWNDYAFALGFVDQHTMFELTDFIESFHHPVQSEEWDRALVFFKQLQQKIKKFTDGINESNVMVPFCGVAYSRRSAGRLNEEDVIESPIPPRVRSLIGPGIWAKILSPFMNKMVKPRLRIIPKELIWNQNERMAITSIANYFTSHVKNETLQSILQNSGAKLVFINGQTDMVTNSIGVTEYLDKAFGWYYDTPQKSFKSLEQPCGTIGYYKSDVNDRVYHFRLLYTGHVISKENRQALRTILKMVFKL